MARRILPPEPVEKSEIAFLEWRWSNLFRGVDRVFVTPEGTSGHTKALAERNRMVAERIRLGDLPLPERVAAFEHCLAEAGWLDRAERHIDRLLRSRSRLRELREYRESEIRSRVKRNRGARGAA